MEKSIAEESLKVAPIVDRKRPMIASANVLDTARGMALALIERAERETGSRMSAYERVAVTIGVSASWLRKFVARSSDVKCPNFIAGLNIIAQYERLIARIDAAAEQERQRANELWGRIDAAAAGAMAMVAGTPTAETRRENPALDREETKKILS